MYAILVMAALGDFQITKPPEFKITPAFEIKAAPVKPLEPKSTLPKDYADALDKIRKNGVHLTVIYAGVPVKEARNQETGEIIGFGVAKIPGEPNGIYFCYLDSAGDPVMQLIEDAKGNIIDHRKDKETSAPRPFPQRTSASGMTTPAQIRNAASSPTVSGQSTRNSPFMDLDPFQEPTRTNVRTVRQFGITNCVG